MCECGLKIKSSYFSTTVEEIFIPDATGKCLTSKSYDFRCFKLNFLFAGSNDLPNRKILEPSFEAIVDAGKCVPTGSN